MYFDVALGVRQDELNEASQSIYGAIYPGPFKGTAPGSFQGVDYAVDYDVQAAPTFDLSTPAAAGVLLDHLIDRSGAIRDAAGSAPEQERIEGLVAALPSLADALPTFTVAFPVVALTLVGTTTTSLTLALTAVCAVQCSGSTISFVPLQVSAPPQSDPVTDWLVQNVVRPQVETLLQTLLSGVQIPPIAVSGLALSPPSFGIAGDSVVACANIGGSTPQPPDPSAAWPDSPFFALLGPNVVQALVAQELASASNSFSNNDSGGDSWAGWGYSYGIDLADPQTGIDDDGSISMTFGLSGAVSGKVEVVYVSIGLDFDASASPNPGVTAGLEVEGSQVNIVTRSVSPFVIVVTPGGSVPDWVLGWLISAIIDSVTVTLTPLITQFLSGISISSLQIPTYSVQVDGRSLSLTPSNLQVGSSQGCLALTGGLAIA